MRMQKVSQVVFEKATTAIVGLAMLANTSAWAGLPTAFKALPSDLSNPNGYSLLAAQDANNPRQIAKDSVYYFPSGSRQMPIGVQNFNSTVLDKTGKRGNMCVALDQDFEALNLLTAKYDARLAGLMQQEEAIAKRIAAAEDRAADQCATTIVAESDVAKTIEQLDKVSSELTVAGVTVNNC